jgi:hypothetical protein
MRMSFLSSLVILALTLGAACAGDDDDDGQDDQSDPGDGDEGDCTGDVTDCRLADLSDEQYATWCDTFLAVVEDPPGTTYECEESGLTLTVTDREACLANQDQVSSSCPVTAGEVIDCYLAARDDACEAFAEDGACGYLLTSEGACF